MRSSVPVWGPTGQWRRALLCGVLLLPFSASLIRAQDLAEAARQEQARKAAQPITSRHVYTEDDLKQPKILTPEDQARVEARKKHTDPAASQQNAEMLPDRSNPQAESLGEVARRCRREKDARVAGLEEQEKFIPFPHSAPDAALAAPRPEVAPRVTLAPRLDLRGWNAPVPPIVPRPSPRETGPRSRISPFHPRPLVVQPPAPPVASAAPLAAPRTSSRSSGVVRLDLLISCSCPQRAGLRCLQVQRGQSWWKLAERYLGSGVRWPELRRLNAEPVGPLKLLKLGSIVLVPERVQARQETTQQRIVVRKGDSLWLLAREHLGRGSAWTCLARSNPQVVDYLHLTIGASLQLPAAETLASCPRRILVNSRK